MSGQAQPAAANRGLNVLQGLVPTRDINLTSAPIPASNHTFTTLEGLRQEMNAAASTEGRWVAGLRAAGFHVAFTLEQAGTFGINGQTDVNLRNIHLLADGDRNARPTDPADQIAWDEYTLVARHCFDIFMKLVTCYQIKPYTNRSAASLFLECDGPRIVGANVIAEVVIWANCLPRLESIDGILDSVRSTKWGVYHSSVNSSAGLIKRIETDCPEMYEVIFSAAERAAVNRSFDNPTSLALSQAIPQKVLGVAWVYHDTIGSGIENWPSGVRANEGMSAVVKLKYRALFKAYKAFVSRSGVYEDVTSLADILARFSALETGNAAGGP